MVINTEILKTRLVEAEESYHELMIAKISNHQRWQFRLNDLHPSEPIKS